MIMKKELNRLREALQETDRKVFAIFISVALLQTVAFYFTSPAFFRHTFGRLFEDAASLEAAAHLFWLGGDVLLFLVVPVLIIIFGFRERLMDYGLQAGDYKAGLAYSLLFLVLMTPLIWGFSADPSFSLIYPQYGGARESWLHFILFEVGVVVYMLGWEFIWRGFMLFGLYPRFGYSAVAIQMLPFVALHFGKPFPETLGAIAGGLALGVLAVRTRSVLYCVLVHAGVMFLIDIFSVLRYRTGIEGAGLQDFVYLLITIF